MKKLISQIWRLAKKELKSYFDSPLAYVLLIVWQATASYFFFRTVFLIGEVSLRPLFELLPWLLLFFVPAVTMRSLAAEKKDKTLEVLLSHPVSETELVIGKLTANVLFILVALMTTIPIALGLSLGGRLDLGMVAAQYLGAFLLIVGLSSVGLFASSLSGNQTVAFIVSLFLTFVLIITGLEFVLMTIPFSLTGAARQISALSHFDSMTRGVLSLGDLAYFAGLTAIFAALSYFILRRDRESKESVRYKNLRIGTTLIVVISVFAALIGSVLGGRLDLTAGRVHSLSGATAKILKELPDVVTIKLYFSRELPPEAETALRSVKDILLDYQTTGDGRVKTIFKSPKDSSQAQQELQEAGIQTVQFNVVRQDEYQVKQGYLGVAIEYRNKREAIPFVNKTDDLEYQLSSLIRKIAAKKQKKVGFLIGHSRPQIPNEAGAPADDYSEWKESLRKEHEVVDLDMTKEKEVPPDINTVIIAGPISNPKKRESKALTAFVERGGSILALIDALTVDDRMMTAAPNKGNFGDFLAKYGFKVEPKLLFDLEANQMITAGGGEGSFFSLPYPFWMQVSPGSDNAMVRDIGSVTIPWGHPVSTKKKSEDLLVTTEFAGVQKKNFNILPDPEFPFDREKLKSRVVGAARKLKNGARLVVIGDADFLKNRFVSAPESDNLIFGQNAVDWLAQDQTLTEIRSKNTQGPRLVFTSETVRDLVRYGNLIVIPVLTALFGAARLSRRRRLTRKVYAA